MMERIFMAWYLAVAKLPRSVNILLDLKGPDVSPSWSLFGRKFRQDHLGQMAFQAVAAPYLIQHRCLRSERKSTPGTGVWHFLWKQALLHHQLLSLLHAEHQYGLKSTVAMLETALLCLPLKSASNSDLFFPPGLVVERQIASQKKSHCILQSSNHTHTQQHI